MSFQSLDAIVMLLKLVMKCRFKVVFDVFGRQIEVFYQLVLPLLVRRIQPANLRHDELDICFRRR